MSSHWTVTMGKPKFLSVPIRFLDLPDSSRHSVEVTKVTNKGMVRTTFFCPIPVHQGQDTVLRGTGAGSAKTMMESPWDFHDLKERSRRWILIKNKCPEFCKGPKVKPVEKN